MSAPPSFFGAPSADASSAEGLDVALLGAPFEAASDRPDGRRPGGSSGPAAMREASRRLRRCNQCTGSDPFEGAAIADAGDAPTDPKTAEGFVRRLRERGARPLAAGGDRAATVPLLRGLAPERPLGLIQIDAHAETATGGPTACDGDAIRRAVEEGWIDPRRTAQIGLRGTLLRSDLWRFSAEAGMRVVQIEEIEARGWRACMEEALALVGRDPVYVSIHLSALDPAFAPGVDAPEAGGLTMREALGMARMLRVCDVRGGEVLGLAPPHDPDGVTALGAATLLFELLCATALRLKAS